MALEEITDHVLRALTRVTVALRGTEFENLVRSSVTEVQTVEHALHGLLDVFRNPSLAVGVWLDLLGSLVGAEARGTHGDAQYRLRIAAAIARNASWCQPEDLIATVTAFFPTLTVVGGGPGLVLRDADTEGRRSAVVAPASYLSASNYHVVTPAEAEELMRYVARAAATRVIFEYASTARAGAGTLSLFDSGNFDTEKFSGAVDQKTRN